MGWKFRTDWTLPEALQDQGFAPTGSSCDLGTETSGGGQCAPYFLTQMAMQTTSNDLYDRCKEIARQLETSSGDYACELLDDALDIQFTMSARGEFLGARILVAFGGPNIWIDTCYEQVEGYWWGDTAISIFSDEHDLHGRCEELFDCLR